MCRQSLKLGFASFVSSFPYIWTNMNSVLFRQVFQAPWPLSSSLSIDILILESPSESSTDEQTCWSPKTSAPCHCSQNPARFSSEWCSHPGSKVSWLEHAQLSSVKSSSSTCMHLLVMNLHDLLWYTSIYGSVSRVATPPPWYGPPPSPHTSYILHTPL